MNKEEIQIQIQKFSEELYKRGYDDGQKDWHNLEEEREKAYKKGLEEGWKTAEKYAEMSEKEYCKYTGRIYKHGKLGHISVFEAVRRIKEFNTDEIKVGDEIEYDSVKFVVLQITPLYFDGITVSGTGMSVGRSNMPNIKKTGRTFYDVFGEKSNNE